LIAHNDVTAYDRAGVVCLRQAFDPAWVERLRGAVERDLASPGPHATNFAEGSTAGRFFGDMYMWRRDPEFRAAALDSPAAAIAARPMASVWIALDDIDRSNGAVEFVAGSHRWGINYRPTPFRKGHEIKFTDSDLVPIPDIDADRTK
jgi:hypothetical protein